MLLSHALILAMLVLIPLAVIVLLGSRTWTKMTPLSFECRRCNRSFEAPAWKGFPRRCARCRARNWNV